MSSEELDEHVMAVQCSIESIASSLADSSDESLGSALRTGLHRVASAITPPDSAAEDATGGACGSLTEAVMGMTAALVKIADAMESIAEAIKEK